MKWIKHMTQSHADEKLADLISECGLEGYGFWWLLVEVVGAQCVDEKCHATYSLPQWSRLLYSHHHKVSKYLGKLGVMGIVTVEYEESRVRVTIPNLLKYRDEYSKKSRHNPDGVLPKKEKEKEKEKETTTINPNPNPKPKPIPKVKRFVTPSIEEVTAYCSERNRGVDPQRWIDHYTANGWKCGKNLAPMKDWQAAVRTWEDKTKPLVPSKESEPIRGTPEYRAALQKKLVM